MKKSTFEQMAGQEDITEYPKQENQMERVRRINNIRSQVEELITRELILASYRPRTSFTRTGPAIFISEGDSCGIYASHPPAQSQ